ncbi:hypothetical protein B0T10DRAFT_568921 [Thelonectria olida]|uniref:NACHT domain-containing protein n=1 Tax=Thelonectria olida TaxID=1576542 RepID=A0A9P8VR87_9HYPO|nr:hypothetical protein B0T10DRAFT_568921 [Thelonectria olida]
MSGVSFHGPIDGRNIFAGNSVSGGTVNIQLPSERPDTPPNPSTTIIPFCRDPNFVPRGDVLERIHQLCSEPAGRVALVGLGGVGKSQLAIEFAHQLKDHNVAGEDQMWVFWVHAGTATRIEEGFKAIADATKIPGRNQPNADIMQLVYCLLSNETWGRWCMILDSADEHGVLFGVNGNNHDGRSLATYLPQSRNGSILLTTRNRDLAHRLTGDHQAMIEVGPMMEIDALKLLENKLGSLSDAIIAADLVRALDFIPLAISQAAAYIRSRAPRTSLERYLAEFRESEIKRTRLLGHDAGDLRRDGGASNAILTTWQLSFNHIRSQRPPAADLLSLMSFFNRQGIPEWLLKHSRNTVIVRCARLDERADSESEIRGGCLLSLMNLFHRRGTPKWLLNSSRRAISAAQASTDEGTHTKSDDDHREIDSGFEDDVAMLRDYCLVTVTEGEDLFEMHGLVQLSTRRWLEASNLQETFKDQYIALMAGWFPTGDYEHWGTCKTLFPHAEAALEHRPKNDGVKETWAGLLYNGGWYALAQGMYGIAEKMLFEAKRMREKRLGREDEATLASVSILALIYRNQGRWEEAEKLFTQVMETRKSKLGVDHPSTLISMGDLASTYRNQGRWEEAEKLEVKVMETSKTKLGADHPDTLTSMANLASTYRNQGRWEEAEKLFTQVMETRKSKLGADHPDTLMSMGNLASTFWNQGRWEEAEKLDVQVMETSKTKLGADHPDTLTSMANLASTFSSQGRWEEAKKLEVQVMETQKTKLGADHPDILISMGNLASTYRNQGRWEEAEKLEVQVMETRKTKLGVDHHSTLISMGNLASTYRNQGRWEEAEKLEVQVMETLKMKLGADHPDTLTSMCNLAFTWSSQGRDEEALVLMEKCAQARQQVLGAKHPDTISSFSTLGAWRS